MDTSLLINNIFGNNLLSFNEKVALVHKYQFKHNEVYRNWCITVTGKEAVAENCYLPVSFFKQFKVVCGNFLPEIVFESSGTTQTINSQHFVKDLSLYIQSFELAFQQFYGKPQNWCIIGLLPAYLERQHSSLVFMVDHLMKQTAHSKSGFYLYNHEELAETLALLESMQQPTLLIGVTFALLDFADKFPMRLQYTTIMETGGMKGRKREIIREEVHATLQQAFGVPAIHSEYGMTELLSQAYSKGNGRFYCPPWMKVMVRDEEDPLQVAETGKGILNIIDLANIHSCSFIATDDVGIVYEDGSFEVLGRLDHSDLRGCSLLTVS